MPNTESATLIKIILRGLASALSQKAVPSCSSFSLSPASRSCSKAANWQRSHAPCAFDKVPNNVLTHTHIQRRYTNTLSRAASCGITRGNCCWHNSRAVLMPDTNRRRRLRYICICVYTFIYICVCLCVCVYCPAFTYFYTALWQTMQNKQQERKKLTAYLLRNTKNSLSGFALNMFTLS